MVVSEYEAQRLRNITENQKILKNLGLHADVKKARAHQEALRTKREETRALKRKRVALAEEEKKEANGSASPPVARRSRRTRSQAPDYSERQRVFGGVGDDNESADESDSHSGSKKKKKKKGKNLKRIKVEVKREKPLKEKTVLDYSVIWAPQAETRQRWERHVANAQQQHHIVKTEYSALSKDMLRSIDAEDLDAQNMCDLPKSGASQEQWQTCAVKRWGALVGSAHDSPVDDWAAFVMSRLPQPLLGLDRVKTEIDGEKSGKVGGKTAKATDVKAEEGVTATKSSFDKASNVVALPALSPLSLMQEMFRGDVWQLVVSCALMSRVASGPLKERVIKAFFNHYPTPTSALQGDMAHMAEVLAPLGLFPTRYRSLMEVSQRFVEMQVFDLGMVKKVNKVYGFGEFSVASYEIFCRGNGANMDLPTDCNLRAFCLWLRRQQRGGGDPHESDSEGEE